MDDASFDLRTSRRGFLGLAGATAALTTLGGLRALPAAAQTAAAPDGSGFFSARQTEILTQIVERMVDTGDPAAPSPRETRAVETIDRLCASLDPAVTRVLPVALWLFELGPIFFDFTFSRFTHMTDAEKDASLEAWRRSRLGVRRLAFLALRNLSLLGYYSQEETWPLIGYGGPLLRPVRGA